MRPLVGGLGHRLGGHIDAVAVEGATRLWAHGHGHQIHHDGADDEDDQPAGDVIDRGLSRFTNVGTGVVVRDIGSPFL